MKVGERGQVTITKEIRDRFGIEPGTEVVWRVMGTKIVLEKAPTTLALEKWKGRWRRGLKDLGYATVDEAIEDARGR